MKFNEEKIILFVEVFNLLDGQVKKGKIVSNLQTIGDFIKGNVKKFLNQNCKTFFLKLLSHRYD